MFRPFIVKVYVLGYFPLVEDQLVEMLLDNYSYIDKYSYLIASFISRNNIVPIGKYIPTINFREGEIRFRYRDDDAR